ncbi:unnamed protein product [Vicia faba]|uniref:Uncharacterized protein n=1 Tax=Vicia faba TaxID=3906 RepID=A0AAV1BDJ5_VICFA|nr:unnamed protein product [Vicia faba]
MASLRARILFATQPYFSSNIYPDIVFLFVLQNMSVTKLQFQPFYFPHLFCFVGGYEIQFMVSERFLNCFPKSSFLYCLGFSNFQSSPCSSAISDDKDVTVSQNTFYFIFHIRKRFRHPLLSSYSDASLFFFFVISIQFNYFGFRI